MITQGTAYHAIVTLPLEYTVSFTITPQGPTVASWASIL